MSTTIDETQITLHCFAVILFLNVKKLSIRNCTMLCIAIYIDAAQPSVFAFLIRFVRVHALHVRLFGSLLPWAQMLYAAAAVYMSIVVCVCVCVM